MTPIRAVRPLIAVLRQKPLWAALPAMLAACGAYDDGVPASIDSAVPVRQSVVAADDARCDFSGTWALKFEIPVTWRFNGGVESGGGTIVQWALSERTMADEHHIEERFTPCGSTVPTYRASSIAGGERYGVAFDDAIFDDGTLATIPGRTWVSQRAPGATFDADAIVIAMGINLPNAAVAPWPKKARDLMAHLVDTDHDGNPGVTMRARDDGPLQLPPVNASKSSRAKEFYLAMRNVMGAQGKVQTCDRFEGNAKIPDLGGAPALSSSVVGCRLTTGELCSRGHADLSNRFQPSYRLAEGSRSTMVRVPSNTTCAQVRAQEF